ncbi:hypothetical protein DPMN_180115 [Dreissena polymorpha]|uniref:Uncharacterized protein n=1 Tax=Dreissena polymorpha TaxID=45954 RepID=A0A9D4IMR4_DREPO|nr:hypothetical protein DPMN_179890 [Dreissena polymorpha]KAH3778645.1 hypothetical protein DPMN_180115 [Dreissena polymorpha]
MKKYHCLRERVVFARYSSLPAYFCRYLRERLVFCMIIKSVCLILWIPQGKACVLQDHQVCLPTSVDTSEKGLCSA